MKISFMQAQQPKWKTWHKVVIGICLLGTIGIFIGPARTGTDNTKASAKFTPQQKDSIERRAILEKNFSSWDGSHRNLVKFVKDNMNDPNSFEHVETRFIDLGDSSIIVTMKYRGKNAFGGVITTNITAETTLDGSILKISN